MSLIGGLTYITELIARSSMRQSLYARQCESNSNNGQLLFRDTLKRLYIRILEFQAKSICYYSGNGAFRLGLDMVKWNDWDYMLDEIRSQEKIFCEVYGIWKDDIYLQEFDKLVDRHSEQMNVMNLISDNISDFLQVREKANDDDRRTMMVNWLSDADPSTYYGAALKKHQTETCERLIKGGNEEFEAWKVVPNSFLWINGKGLSIVLALNNQLTLHSWVRKICSQVITIR